MNKVFFFQFVFNFNIYQNVLSMFVYLIKCNFHSKHHFLLFNQYFQLIFSIFCLLKTPIFYSHVMKQRSGIRHSTYHRCMFKTEYLLVVSFFCTVFPRQWCLYTYSTEVSCLTQHTTLSHDATVYICLPQNLSFIFIVHDIFYSGEENIFCRFINPMLR